MIRLKSLGLALTLSLGFPSWQGAQASPIFSGDGVHSLRFEADPTDADHVHLEICRMTRDFSGCRTLGGTYSRTALQRIARTSYGTEVDYETLERDMDIIAAGAVLAAGTGLVGAVGRAIGGSLGTGRATGWVGATIQEGARDVGRGGRHALWAAGAMGTGTIAYGFLRRTSWVRPVGPEPWQNFLDVLLNADQPSRVVEQRGHEGALRLIGLAAEMLSISRFYGAAIPNTADAGACADICLNPPIRPAAVATPPINRDVLSPVGNMDAGVVP